MKITPIHDIHDPRLFVYRDVKERDLIGREGVFLAEGAVVLDAIAASGRPITFRSVLVSDRRLARHEAVLGRLAADVEVLVLPHAQMETLVGFPIHRGLLAACDVPPPLTPSGLLGALAEGLQTVVVLEGLTNTDNVGAVFRNAAAFGAGGVLLSERCCDPLYRRAIRVSAGHTLTVPFARGTMAELLEACARRGFYSIATSLREDATPLTPGAQRPAERCAIMLGTEGSGLSPFALGAADDERRIAIASGVDSLNVATAGAIALFALSGGVSL